MIPVFCGFGAGEKTDIFTKGKRTKRLSFAKDKIGRLEIKIARADFLSRRSFFNVTPHCAKLVSRKEMENKLLSTD